MSERARRLWRIAAILAIAGVPLVASFFNLAGPFVPYGKFGFVARGSGSITAVLPSSAAAEAGLKPGHRFDVAALSPQERVYLHWPRTLVGRRADFLLSEGPARSVTLVARRASPGAIYFALWALLALADIAVLLISVALVLARPSRMTWAFLFYAAGSITGSPTLTALLPPSWVVAYSAYAGVLWFGSSAALIVFALRFPTDRVRGAGAVADRWLPWLAVAFAPLIIAANVLLVYRGVDTDAFEHFLTIVSTALYCLAIAVFGVRYVTEGRDERPRMAWVIAAFLVGYAGIIVLRICETIGLTMPAHLVLGLLALNVTVPIAVAYAIRKQRVISVQFFVNKALIFAVLSVVGVGILALLDWSIARRLAALFSGTGMAAVIAVNAAAVLALGLLMPRLYAPVRDVVDRSFFQRQYRARQSMLQLADGLAHADSVQTIDEVLVRNVAGDLEIGSVAIFARGEDGTFRREAAEGWGDDHVLERLDTERLAVAFEEARGALRFADPHPVGRRAPAGDGAPAMGIPIFVDGKLSRFVLFSGHPHGLDLDPSETRLLGEVTRAASHGFARLSQL